MTTSARCTVREQHAQPRTFSGLPNLTLWRQSWLQESYTSAESFRCCRRCAVDSSVRNRHLRNPTGGHGNRWEDQWYGQSHLVNKGRRRRARSPQKTDREDTKTFSGGTEFAGNLSGRDRSKCSRGRTKEKETQRKPMRNMGNPQETAGNHEKPSGNA